MYAPPPHGDARRASKAFQCGGGGWYSSCCGAFLPRACLTFSAWMIARRLAQQPGAKFQRRTAQRRGISSFGSGARTHKNKTAKGHGRGRSARCCCVSKPGGWGAFLARLLLVNIMAPRALRSGTDVIEALSDPEFVPALLARRAESLADGGRAHPLDDGANIPRRHVRVVIVVVQPGEQPKNRPRLRGSRRPTSRPTDGRCRGQSRVAPSGCMAGWGEWGQGGVENEE